MPNLVEKPIKSFSFSLRQTPSFSFYVTVIETALQQGSTYHYISKCRAMQLSAFINEDTGHRHPTSKIKGEGPFFKFSMSIFDPLALFLLL